MTNITTTPHTISLRPTAVVAALAVTVAASAGLTWGLTSFEYGDGGDTVRPAQVGYDSTEFLDGIAQLTPEQLAASYGYTNYPIAHNSTEFLDGIAQLTPEQLAASYGYTNYPIAHNSTEFLDGIVQLTPEQLAASYGHTNYPDTGE